MPAQTELTCVSCGTDFDPAETGGFCPECDTPHPDYEREGAEEAAEEETEEELEEAEAELDEAEAEVEEAEEEIEEAEAELEADEAEAAEEELEEAEEDVEEAEEELEEAEEDIEEAEEELEEAEEAEEEPEAIECANCGHEADADFKFCPNCGDELEVETEETIELDVCPDCGEDVDEEMSFCPNCGHDLEAAREEPGIEAPSAPEEVTLIVNGEEYAFGDGDTFGRQDEDWLPDLVEASGGRDEVAYISSEHLTFSVEDDGIYVSDTSANGTRLNGDELDGGTAKLSDGDVLELADRAEVEVEL